MAIFVEKNGLLDTVQDLGRYGCGGLGVGTAGAMDRAAARLANALVGNEDDAAVLEMHFPAPVLRFERECVFALGGADFAPELNGETVRIWKCLRAAAGDPLRFARRRSGGRSYLAVQGGLKAEIWLGSASTDLFVKMAGVDGKPLAKGAKLDLEKPHSDQRDGFLPELGLSARPKYAADAELRAIRGPEHHMLTALSGSRFIAEEFSVTRDSNRMGFRLGGAALETLTEADMLSSAVDFGTVQLLPNGQLIILMADHQTTGGYPRIANIISADLSIASQLVPGDKVRFRIVSCDEAEVSLRSFERELGFLRMGIRLRSR